MTQETESNPLAVTTDPLAALKAQLARAKGIKIEIPEADRERATLLADLAAEAARIKAERHTRDEFTMNEERFAARQRLGENVILDSAVLGEAGAFVVRGPTKEERKKLNDSAGKASFDVASINFAVAVTVYPDLEALKLVFERFPYVIDSLVTMAMKAGGAQIDSDARKSG